MSAQIRLKPPDSTILIALSSGTQSCSITIQFRVPLFRRPTTRGLCPAQICVFGVARWDYGACGTPLRSRCANLSKQRYHMQTSLAPEESTDHRTSDPERCRLLTTSMRCERSQAPCRACTYRYSTSSITVSRTTSSIVVLPSNINFSPASLNVVIP